MALGEIVGTVGILIAAGREWVAARDRRRVRPVVVVHEARGRHFRQDQGLAVLAYLTNESAATAFNVRFGVELDGVLIPFKHSDEDENASRLNVVPPGDREPAGDATFEIRLPQGLGWSQPGADPDPGRSYWAQYQGPGGEWWTTRNPWRRDGDFEVKRLALRRWRTTRRAQRDSTRLQLDEDALRQAWDELAPQLRRARR
jgi:hypothetical protein